MSSLSHWLRPPPSADPEEALRARITHWMVFAAIVAMGLLMALLPLAESYLSVTGGVYLASLVGALFTFAVLHSGRIRTAGAMFATLALLLSYVGVFASAAIGSPQLATAVLVITITGFLVGTRAGIWTAVGISVSLLALVYGREIGVVPEPLPEASPYMTWAALTSIIALSAVFVHVFVSAMNDARRDAAEKSSALEEEMLRREKAEAALRRAEKLEALGRLTGGIAHDFNNILTVLLAESQMLEEHAVAGRPLGAEELEQIAELRRSSERAAALTGQLLSFSRQRVGTPEIIDLNAALRRLQPLLKRVIREEIRLDIDLPAKVGAVRMEVAQFDQVVMNLILNACDALPSRGQVTVHTATVDCDETWLATHPDARLGPHVMLSVSDTGSGIGAEHIDQIFDPFFTTKDQSLRPGTGLGLASVHGIVTAAGGHITVESEEGSGTRFCVYLPRAAEDSLPERLTDAPAPPRPEKRSILLCEDDSAVRRVLLHMLDRSEFDVYEAETPEAALELARTHDGPIDLLLSDVIMPGMNGRELAEAIREIYPRIAILLVSGYASSSLDLEKLGSRVGFLSKPFTQDDLMTRIHDLFRDATTD